MGHWDNMKFIYQDTNKKIKVVKGGEIDENVNFIVQHPVFAAKYIINVWDQYDVVNIGVSIK